MEGFAAVVQVMPQESSDPEAEHAMILPGWSWVWASEYLIKPELSQVGVVEQHLNFPIHVRDPEISESDINVHFRQTYQYEENVCWHTNMTNEARSIPKSRINLNTEKIHQIK